MLSPCGKKLLLILHPRLQRWLQPGGHVEPHDASIVAAARRELEEECGITHAELLDPFFDFDIHTIPGSKREPEHQHFDVRVLLRAHDEILKVGDGVKQAAWVALADLPRCTNDKSVLRVAHKLDPHPKSA